jgi:ATP-binding cassette subfamily B protein
MQSKATNFSSDEATHMITKLKRRFGEVIDPTRTLVRAVIEATRMLWSTGTGLATAAMGLSLSVGLLSIATGVTIAVAVGAVSVYVGHPDPIHRSDLIAALVAFGAIFTLSLLMAPVSEVIERHIARTVEGRIQRRVMDASMTPVGIRHLEEPEMRRTFLAARDVSMYGYTTGNVVNALGPVISDRFTLLGYLIVLLITYWPLGLILGALTVVNQVEMEAGMIRMLGGSRFTLSLEKPSYVRDLTISPGFGKELRIFGLSSWLDKRYRDTLFDALRGTRGRSAPKEINTRLAIVLVVDAAVAAGGLYWLSHLATKGSIAVWGVVFGALAIRALTPKFNLSDGYLSIGLGIFDRVRGVELATAGLSQGISIGALEIPAPHLIRFDQVEFSYDPSLPPVLRGVSFDLRAGESLAIVGENGVGKTTLVKLLCKFYQPTGGRILIDGLDLNSLDVESWREQLAVLFQEFLRYEFSAADNVRFGRWNSEHPIEDALRISNSDEFVDSLPAGRDTVLSSKYPGGHDLSGGQWQRIALARALFAVETGAHVLVLDEPTAELDVRAEASFHQQLLKLTGGSLDRALITLLISHRFSTVRNADRIIVLSQGTVVEEGSHEDLVSHAGLYAEMFASQAVRYRDAAASTDLDIDAQLAE